MRHDITPFGTNRSLARDFGGTSPFGMLSTVNRLMDELWRDFDGAAGRADGGLHAPTIDLSEDDKAVYVTADLPGLSETDLQVDFADGRLRIAGQRTQESGDEGRTWVVSERRHGRFERIVPIAREIDADKVEATFKDGVLTVTLPKLAEAEGTRRIEVRRAH